MRLNRGTILLVIIALVVIVGALILNNNQATAPGDATPTAGAASVALFPDVTPQGVTSVATRDNATGALTQLIRAGENWAIQATNAADRAADPAQIETLLSSLVTLQGEGGFEAGTEASPLSRFGLDQPDYTLFVTTANQAYTIYIGNTNPAGNRFYAVVETEAVGEMTTPEAISSQPEGTAEATDEASTTAATSAEASAEATVEVPTGALADPNSPLLTAPNEILPEATVEPTVLEGARTIVLLNSQTVRSLINTIDTPPYVPPPTPTATPTNTPNPISEVDQTATAVIDQTATMSVQQTLMADFAATATAAASTAEVTAEATAAP
jgi:hypothetical protein